MARGLVDVGVDRDHEVEARQRPVEASAVRALCTVSTVSTCMLVVLAWEAKKLAMPASRSVETAITISSSVREKPACSFMIHLMPSLLTTIHAYCIGYSGIYLMPVRSYSVATTEVFIVRPFHVIDSAAVFILPLVVTVQLLM